MSTKKYKSEVATAQDPVEYWNQLNKIRAKHEGKIITEIDSHAAIPMQSKPVNIPGYQGQAGVQVSIQINYITAVIYEVDLIEAN